MNMVLCPCELYCGSVYNVYKLAYIRTDDNKYYTKPPDKMK